MFCSAIVLMCIQWIIMVCFVFFVIALPMLVQTTGGGRAHGATGVKRLAGGWGNSLLFFYLHIW
jgi:hypothetical protein